MYWILKFGFWKYDKIYKANNNIKIACGFGYGGLLGTIWLDDLQEFYV